MNEYEQLDLFDDILTEFKITKPVRLISFFSGIEAQYKALSFLGKYLNTPVESYKTCEWAYNSIIACNAIHNRDFTDYGEGKTKEELIDHIRGISINYNEPLTDEQLNKKSLPWLKNAYNNCIANHNLINIMDVKGEDLEIKDTEKYTYVLSYSFPCQDLSLAGKRAGMDISQADGGTRSGLLWEFERILTELKEKQPNDMPSVLIMENVPQIHSEKDNPSFIRWQIRLEELGYVSYWKDLNAKDFGIPQNRERTFMVSIYGKDFNYKFPNSIKREYNLKDFLESDVDEKYYLSKKMIDYLTGVNQKKSKYNRGEVFERNFDPDKDIAATITTAAGQRATDNFIPVDLKRGYSCNVKEEKDSVDGVENHGQVTAITEKDNNFVTEKYIEYMKEHNGEIPEMFNPYNKAKITDIAPTQTTASGINTTSSAILIKEEYQGTYDYAQSDTLRPTEKDRFHENADISGTVLASGNQNGIAIKIVNNTEQGYLEAHEGDGINIGSRMHHQRGNVQPGMVQTLKTSGGNEVGVVVNENLKQHLCNELIEKGLVKEESLFTETEASLFTKDGNIRRYLGSDQVDEFKDGQMATTTFPNGYGHGTRVHNESITLNTVDRPVVKQNLRIRKLTPKECLRLMAFTDKDYENVKEIGLGDSAIYHMAGDSIVVCVLLAIFSKLYGLDNLETEKIIRQYIKEIII